MRFKQFLLEETMSVTRALEIFGLKAKDVSDKGLVKRTFARLAKINHPDHGGDTEQMKLVNIAYDILKKGTLPGRLGGSEFWDDLHAKYKALGSVIKTALIAGFKPEVFTNYFEKLKGEPFYHEMLHTWPQEHVKNPSFAGFSSEFFTKDRNTIFQLEVFANLTDIMHNNSIGFQNLDFTLNITAYGFFNNKKQKLSKQDWKFTNDHSFFSRPEKIFPKNKLDKIFSGSTSKRPFKKRDMFIFLTKKLKGSRSTDPNYVYIPLKDDYWLLVYRSTMMRQAFWMPNGIYYKRLKRVDRCPVVTFPEDETTALYFERIQKKAKNGRNEQTIINIVNSLLQVKKGERLNKTA